MSENQLREIARRTVTEIAQQQPDPVAFLAGIQQALRRLRRDPAELAAAARTGLELLTQALAE